RGEACAHAVKGALTHRRKALLSARLAVEPIDGSGAFGLRSGVVGPQMRLEELHGSVRDTRSAVAARSHTVKQPQVAAPILGLSLLVGTPPPLDGAPWDRDRFS